MMGKNSAQAIRKAPVEAEIRGEKVKMDKKAVNMDNVIIYQRIESLDDRERALFAFSMAERIGIGLRYYRFSTSCF